MGSERTHTHTMMSFSLKKEGNPVICDNMDKPVAKVIMLNEISQTEKDKYYMASLIRGIFFLS